VLRGAEAFSADQILALHKAPLAAVDGFAVGNGRIEIAGMALAPDGDPHRVKVDLDQNIVFQLHYPLPSPGATKYYWYWPNADRIAFKLNIDLAASIPKADALRFTFGFDAPDVKLADLKNTFYVPLDLRRYMNVPSAEKLSRVQTFDTINGVVVRGYSDYRRIRAISEHYGLNIGSGKILDWGSGHGRVIRHFEEVGPDVELYGVDIDADNIHWAADHLPNVRCTHGPLMPPLPFADSTFNLVFGISVMTHLTPAVQAAWLAEIQRVLRPGGMALLTFSGDTDVAFNSYSMDQKWMADYIATGRGSDLPSGDLIGKIEDDDYYKNVKNAARIVHARCAEYFEVLDVLECMFGYQDLAVLRKRQ
jgi:ubiquinone/menaquinone biosynthesis C-methylase UbiE